MEKRSLSLSLSPPAFNLPINSVIKHPYSRHLWVELGLHSPCPQGNYPDAFTSPWSHSFQSLPQSQRHFSASTIILMCLSFLHIYLESRHYNFWFITWFFSCSFLSHLITTLKCCILLWYEIWHSLWGWSKGEINASTELYFTVAIMNDRIPVNQYSTPPPGLQLLGILPVGHLLDWTWIKWIYLEEYKVTNLIK